jgi:hypothetical protein
LHQHLQNTTLFAAEAQQIQHHGCDLLLSFPQVGSRCDNSFDFSTTLHIVRERYFR